ncbi:hypothetical protein DUNSADRAFT_4238 [Dunaliella salina]|uniref:Encoded protein n=1 Tax=Dunaliella salina TaxID=3046 RepID=A0ABQ7GSI0_DUNSA|nr:hypothetical protein DUNSADRAFT_4238 [Dunaliella salina]|eukprot:KAF5837545.1 hypothetical protein DUNSADRAFT_4238 [Dunaliella salina]
MKNQTDILGSFVLQHSARRGWGGRANQGLQEIEALEVDTPELVPAAANPHLQSMESQGKPLLLRARAKSASQSACLLSSDCTSMHTQQDENVPHEATVSPFLQAAYLPDPQVEASPVMDDQERRVSRLSTVLSWKRSYRRSSSSSLTHFLNDTRLPRMGVRRRPCAVNGPV